MLGELPRTLDISGKTYQIRTDFRDILRIFSAFHDEKLSDREKVYVMMAQIYPNLSDIPKMYYREAYEKAHSFIECRMQEDRPGPQLIDWEKDEQLIFPAINKVAGTEVRSLTYLHWWTFLGYFQGINREDTWGYVLQIRQKRIKHKKLDKGEQEFYNANRLMCELHKPKNRKEKYDELEKLYEELKRGG